MLVTLIDLMSDGVAIDMGQTTYRLSDVVASMNHLFDRSSREIQRLTSFLTRGHFSERREELSGPGFTSSLAYNCVKISLVDESIFLNSGVAKFDEARIR